MNNTKRNILNAIKEQYKLMDYTDATGAFRSAEREAKRIFARTTEGVPKKLLRRMLNERAFGIKGEEA